MFKQTVQCAVLLLALTFPAAALQQVAGTSVYYSVAQDPITDLNTSLIVIGEQYDSYGQTTLTVHCTNRGKSELWATLRSKHDLLTETDASSNLLPAVTLRLGDEPPITLREAELLQVVDDSETLKTRNIGLSTPVTRQVISGLLRAQRLALRLNRPSGGQALTYLFAPSGFATAWNAVRGCALAKRGAVTSDQRLSRATPPSTSSPAALPQLTRWYFTTCRDAQSGLTRTGLVAGRAHICELVVESLGGNSPTAATFTYELEYRQDGAAGKLQLSGSDSYRPGGNVNFRREGNKLIFSLPLNVRQRPERVYTSLNVIGTLEFPGGAKRVYEPLPVRPN